MEVKVINQNEHVLEICNEHKDMHVFARFDGCCHISRFYNGYTYEDEDIPDYSEPDYLHICDIREFIKFLTDIADKAEQIEGFDGYAKK